MYPIPQPPGETREVHARNVLVLAPHYDDEVLGCGGLITTLALAGATIRILFLTDSSGGSGGERVEDGQIYSATRRQEAERAVAILGEAGDIQILGHLSLPDGELQGHVETLSSSVREKLREVSPDLLLVTSPLEVSADHIAAFLAVHRALSPVRQGDDLFELCRDLKVMTYEVNHLQHPDLLVDVSARLGLLGRAMSAYESQQARHDYWGGYRGRAKMRALTLPPEVEAVEAYRQLRGEDFVLQGAAALVTSLGGRPLSTRVEEGPVVTVIVRTFNRPELLQEALASIAESTYRRLKVVVVNDGGKPPALPESFPFELHLLNLETNLGRAAAANAGIEAADGQYIAFLDDDDLVEPEHYALLVGAASAAGVRVVYSDAAVGVYELDGEEGWRLAERRLPYSRSFQPDLLKLDNYIPFHTLLVERELFDEVGGFDPQLGIFEDWDFLIRLSGKTPFHHLARVTCEYRQFRGAGHHVLGDGGRERADFLATKAKVIAAHRGAEDAELLATVVDRLRSETVAAEESHRHEQRRRERVEDEFHRSRGALQASEEHGRQLRVLEERAREEARELGAEGEGLRRQVAELHTFQEEQSRSLQDAYDEIERLNGLIRAMEATRAWKIHQRLQGLKP